MGAVEEGEDADAGAAPEEDVAGEAEEIEDLAGSLAVPTADGSEGALAHWARGGEGDAASGSIQAEFVGEQHGEAGQDNAAKNGLDGEPTSRNGRGRRTMMDGADHLLARKTKTGPVELLTKSYLTRPQESQ